MDPKIIARAAAVILLGGTVLACAVELTRQSGTLGSSTSVADDNMEPLAHELSRCKVLGVEADHDTACRAVWAQNRSRFLAPSAPHQYRSIELFPAIPDVPEIPKIHPERAPSTPHSDVSTPGTDLKGH